MAELSPKEQLALHEFSVRYRAALAKEHPIEASLETVRDAVRGQYEQEQEAKRDQTIDPPDQSKTQEREPEEPEP